MAKQKQKPISKPAAKPLVVKVEPKKDNTLYWLMGGLLLVVIVYLPSLTNGIDLWDDTEYLNNPYIKDLSLAGIVKIFSVYFAGNYHPLTMISLGTDFLIGGNSPVVFHLTNLILHLFNTYFVYLLVKRLSKNNLLAALTCILFGVHTLHVESVAWVAERKDVLYTFFFLLSLILYTTYASSRKILHYALAMLCFVLSLLSKGQAVVLVILLPFIDYVKDRKWFSIKGLSEKVPFLILSLIFSWVAFRAQASSNYVHFEYFSLPERFAFASYGFTQYLSKSIIPTGLSALYPYPTRTLSGGIPLFYWFFVIAMPVFFAVCYFLFKRSKILVFGLSMFFLSILPLLQLIPVGGAIMADRYFYIPSVGLLLCFAFGLLEIRNSMLRNIIFFLFILGLSAQTYSRCMVWKDNITLWNDEVSKNDAYPLAYYSRGVAYYNTREWDKAMTDYTKAIEIDPKYADAYFSRGIAYDNSGKFDKAIADYSKVVEINPKFTRAYDNRGVDYGRTGHLDMAIEDCSMAITIDPNYADAWSNRGVAYLNLGDWDKAIADCSKAIELDPKSAPAFDNRGIAYLNLHQGDNAIADFTMAIGIDPNSAKAYSDRGFTYNLLGQYDKAIDDFTKALDIDPNNKMAISGRQEAVERLQGRLK